MIKTAFRLAPALLLLACAPASAFFQENQTADIPVTAGAPVASAPGTSTPGGQSSPDALALRRDGLDSPRVRQMGTARVAAPTSGFGRNIPLRVAGPMILPEGWHLRIDGAGLAGTPVSWKSGEPWTQALLSVPGARLFINWPGRRVLMTPPPPPPPVWRLAANLPFRTQIARWAQQAGWTVLFHGRSDFIVPAPSVFTGDFSQALARVVNVARKEGARIRATFYADNTVVIDEGKP